MAHWKIVVRSRFGPTMSAATELNDQQFESAVLKAPGLVLVDFWAPWCGPCRLIAPLMDWAAQTYADQLTVYKLEVDPNPETVARYQVQGIPTLLLFQNGELVERVEGAIGRDRIQTLINAHL